MTKQAQRIKHERASAQREKESARRGNESKRERHTQTNRQADRETHTQRDTHRERERERERERGALVLHLLAQLLELVKLLHLLHFAQVARLEGKWELTHVQERDYEPDMLSEGLLQMWTRIRYKSDLCSRTGRHAHEKVLQRKTLSV